MTFSPAGKKVLAGAAVAAASTALAFLLGAAGVFDRWELRTWDWRASLLARPSPSTDNVRLVLLDQQSLDWAQKENGLSWPWPREVYAAVIGYLRRAGAESIAFDVLFTEPSAYGVADDVALGEAAAGGREFVGALFLGEKSGGATTWPDGIPRYPPRIEGLEPWMTAGKGRGGVTASAGLFPVAEIAGRSPSLADVQNNPDPDGIYRRVRLFRVFDGKPVPSLSLACFLAARPDAPIAVREGSLTVAGRRVPIDGEGFAILRYRGPSGEAYRHYSAAAVIQSELRIQAGEEPVIKDPEAFRGRHVIFGFSAPGLFDLRPTPVGGVFPGSEIHATALDGLLEGDFASGAPPAAAAAAAFLFALSAAVAVGLSRKAWQGLLLFAAFLPLPALLCLFAYSRGWWLPLVVQEAAVSLSLLGALAVNYATEGRQKRYIKNAFRQYLSPDVIEQLIAHPERLKLGGERRVLSIFFSDLQGFTGISEGLDPEALTALLNDYLSAMTDILQEEGGTVDKYIGDAIVAFWNAPLEQPDHAERAARAAIRCQEKLAEMRPLLREKYGKDLFMRVGLNTGPAVVGNMGSRSRFDYTVLGDAVNLASRLEGINKQFGTYVLASEAMRRGLPPSFPAREISNVSVVGRKEPVRVFELLSAGDAAARGKEIEAFAEGLKAFAAGNFARAIEKFLPAAEADPPAAAYARKCRSLIERPPERWEGVWVMTEK
ncbi:MAG: adenylate/guanylate cyclase domain-containing protein [Thermodesulfobacteriota bacterium]